MVDVHDVRDSDRENLQEENRSATLGSVQLPVLGIWTFAPKGIQTFPSE